MLKRVLASVLVKMMVRTSTKSNSHKFQFRREVWRYNNRINEICLTDYSNDDSDIDADIALATN